jgi:hypothetical protein
MVFLTMYSMTLLNMHAQEVFNPKESFVPDLRNYDPSSPAFLPRVPNTLPQQQPTLIFKESFENEADQIVATIDNIPAPTVGGGYVVVGHGVRADNGTIAVSRRLWGDAGVNVRTNENLDGDYLFMMRDIDNVPGPRGDQFGGEDLNNRHARVKMMFDVEGYGNLSIKMVICSGGGTSRFGHEPNDTFTMRVRFDGGQWYAVGGFKGTATNTTPKYYQGPEDTVTHRLNSDDLTYWLEEWEWPIAGHGKHLEVQFTGEGNDVAEDYYIDNVRLYGDLTSPLFSAQFEQPSIQEPVNGGVANPLTITLAQPAPEGGLTLQLLTADKRTERCFYLPQSSVTIPSGQTSVIVPVEIVQDGQYTGPKNVDLYVLADNHTEYARVSIQDSTESPRVMIMEIMMIVPGFSGSTMTSPVGDTSNDGVHHRIINQFVEMVNLEDYPVDISFYRTGDALADNHIFPEGTILQPLQSVVVFSAGNPRGTFGGAIVMISTGGGLAYEVSGAGADLAYLTSSFNSLIDLVHSPMLTVDHQAWALANHPLDHPYYSMTSSGHRLTLDWTGPGFSFTPTSGTVHSMIPGAEHRLFSPGVNFNGQPYFTVENEITLTIDNTLFPEDAGANAATGTITLASPAPAGGMPITLGSNDIKVNDDGSFTSQKITLDSLTFTIPEGQSSATFRIGANYVPYIDGDRVIDIYARGGPYVLPGWATITVQDIEENDYNIVINELYTDVVGASLDMNKDGLFEDLRGDQFIELVNLSGRPVNMSGWTLWWEGRHDWSYPFQAHTFPQGTWVPDGGAIVVFGRQPPNPDDPAFGGAIVQGALELDGSISLNGLWFGLSENFLFNLITPHGLVVFTTDRWNPDIISGKTNQDQSVTRVPDLEGAFDLHFNASLAIGGFDMASPGVKLDLTAFTGSGQFLTPQAFNQAEEIVMGQWLHDPMFGYLALVAPNRADLPWLYAAKRSTFWAVYAGENDGMWLYDMQQQAWLYAKYAYYPHVWKPATSTWVDINRL